VHLTGGVSSYFASLYTLPIIAASTVQSWRGGLMVSVLSLLMFTGWSSGSTTARPLRSARPRRPCRLAWRSSRSLNCSVHAVAGLSGYWRKLRRTARSSRRLDELQTQAFHTISSTV